MAFKILILLFMVTLAASKPQYGSFSSLESAEPARYSFGWAVDDRESGNFFRQEETRNDDDTKGYYTVLLPDGRTQRVTYYVDGDSGFIADVSYDGKSRERSSKPKSRARYGYNRAG